MKLDEPQGKYQFRAVDKTIIIILQKNDAVLL